MTVLGPGGALPEDPFRGLPSFPDAPVVADDPVPYLTRTFERWGAFEVMDPAGHPISAIARALGITMDIPDVPTTRAMAQVLGATQSLVSALSLNERRFSVRFAAIQTAATSTDPNNREVLIGTRAMMARGLTNGQRAAIVMGSAYHEVGHVNWSMMWRELLDKRAAKQGWTPLRRKWAHDILNLAHDLMLEWLMARMFPGYANVLACKNLFNSTAHVVDERTIMDRFNNGITRCRFPWAAEWDGYEALTEAWDDFKARCESEVALEYEVMFRIIDAGLDIIRPDEPDPEPEPPEEPEDPDDEEPPEGPTEPRGEEPTEPGEEPTDEPGDEPGEDGDDEGDDEDPGTPEPDEKPGEDGEGKTEGEGPDEPEEAEPPTQHASEPLDMHGPSFKLDGAWQASVDEFTRAQVAGRDRRIVGGGGFAKREVRIIRLGR